MIEVIERAIYAHDLIEKNERVALGFSGGLDSSVLAYVLCRLQERLNFSLTLLHLEHGIRGDESIRDMEFAKKRARELDTPIIVKRVNVPSMGGNLEDTARKVRYTFFEEQKADKIAVAHHADDALETFLLNLVRGSGANGLSGMKWFRSPNIIRPMLEVSREQLERFAKQEQIPYVSDSTNSSPDYARNFLRKCVVPELRKLNPSVAHSIARTSKIISDDCEALDTIALESYNAVCEEKETGLFLEIKPLCALPHAIFSRILRIALSKLKFSLKNIQKIHIDSICELVIQGENGKHLDMPGFFAEIDYSYLVLRTNKIQRTPKMGTLSFEEAIAPEVFPKYSSLVQYVNPCVVSECVLRFRQAGDRFSPFGMKGSKSLSDWFTDRKISREERDILLIVANGRDVIWIVGHALCESARVNSGEKCLKIRYVCSD